MDSHRKGTCDGCGKVRKLYRSQHADENMQIRMKYYSLCIGCAPLDFDDVMDARRTHIAARRAGGPKPRFAYPCIGGPLDGEYAVTTDFYPTITSRDKTVVREGGIYGHLAYEYSEYNRAHGSTGKRLGDPASMVFLHKSIVKPLARPADR